MNLASRVYTSGYFHKQWIGLHVALNAPKLFHRTLKKTGVLQSSVG